ncbi:gnat family protein [Stemphylium lycopersici]|nr:gnat family protein [Stemphylium lycopersici]
MQITISPADTSHAPLLAELHTTAFSTNRIMRAIYPTAAIWTAFQSAVEKRMRRDIADERTSVIVARVSHERSVGEGDVGAEEDEEERGGEIWSLPEGTDWTVLTPWKEAAANVAEAVIGDREHYGGPFQAHLISPELTWLAVSSTHRRLGIGAQLLNWGLAVCVEKAIPAYLDSTVEAAETFYAKAGFKEKGRIRMMVEGEMYEEVACLFEGEIAGG